PPYASSRWRVGCRLAGYGLASGETHGRARQSAQKNARPTCRTPSRVVGLYLPRSVSFNPPTAFCTFPAALSALPSACSFLSPRTFPATSFTAPLACSAEPLIRSLSITV